MDDKERYDKLQAEIDKWFYYHTNNMIQDKQRKSKYGEINEFSEYITRSTSTSKRN